MNTTNVFKQIIYFFFICLAVIACNKDGIPDPYQPETLQKINRLDFISGNDSSIFIFDNDMILVSGRNNTLTGIKGYEWFTMEYADNDRKLLSGAVYNTASDPDGHRTERKVSYSRDDRNMLSKVTREEWGSRSYTFTYDDKYRLTQLMMNETNIINRFSITYDDRSNVSSVEVYKKVSDVEGTSKIEFSGYDNNSNPFRFLVNVFYAPVFSSINGAVYFGKIESSLGLLLSRNNPANASFYTKNDENWDEDSSWSYSYTIGENSYPSAITGGGLSLKIEFH